MFCLKLFRECRCARAGGAGDARVFYGLALLNGSKYTLDEIKYLGLTQIGLWGWWRCCCPAHGLLLFGAGFGLGHIGYGLLMYNRYERPNGAGQPNFTAP